MYVMLIPDTVRDVQQLYTIIVCVQIILFMYTINDTRLPFLRLIIHIDLVDLQNETVLFRAPP